MKKIFTRDEVLTMNIDHFITVHRMELIAGAVFTRNNGLLSKTIKFFTKKDCKEDFIPSHIGQIILVNKVLYVFDMVPPKGKLTELKEWILNQRDDFRIVLRPFEMDVLRFSTNVFKRVNKKYPYWSAIQTILKINYELKTPKNEDKAISKKAEHCSEITFIEYQKEGYFKNINANKSTPELAYHSMKEPNKDEFIKDNL